MDGSVSKCSLECLLFRSHWSTSSPAVASLPFRSNWQFDEAILHSNWLLLEFEIPNTSNVNSICVSTVLDATSFEVAIWNSVLQWCPSQKTLSFIWLLVIEFFIFDVASWHLNSGPHQESHKIRIMHVPTLLSLAHKRGSQIVAHKTWPTNLSTKRDKTKLWRPALCCEDFMSYIRISLVLMAALCCKEWKTLCLSKKQPCAVAVLCCRNENTFFLSNG